MTREDAASAGSAVALLLLAALALTQCGCGGATATQRTTYAAEVALCQANEAIILGREGTTLEEDTEALEIERARCTAALAEVYP